MQTTSRRNLSKGTAVASVPAALGLTTAPASHAAEAGADKHHLHQKLAGPLANATVSFGAWPTDPALDQICNFHSTSKNRTCTNLFLMK